MLFPCHANFTQTNSHVTIPLKWNYYLLCANLHSCTEDKECSVSWSVYLSLGDWGADDDAGGGGDSLDSEDGVDVGADGSGDIEEVADEDD
jgi:hypothetical protein